jgi:hypothetical protein
MSTPDVRTLHALLDSTGEFTSDDGLREIRRMGEIFEHHWGAPRAGICIPCRRIQERAVLAKEHDLYDLSPGDARLIAWWRPIQDPHEAWMFLTDHADCPQEPLLQKGYWVYGPSPESA